MSKSTVDTSPRVGDWTYTYTGLKFYPQDPRPEEMCIRDIAHALSMQCRFNGHTQVFYSVGEHCCRVVKLLELGADKCQDCIAAKKHAYSDATTAGFFRSTCEKHHRDTLLWGLLHDAAEAYMGDLIRPIKNYSQMGVLFKELEIAIDKVVAVRYKLPYPIPPVVKEADNNVLAAEKRDLFSQYPTKSHEANYIAGVENIATWTPYSTELEFLKQFERLSGMKAQEA